MRKYVILILCLAALCAALWRSMSPRRTANPESSMTNASAPAPESPPSIALADDRNAARTAPRPTTATADSDAITPPVTQASVAAPAPSTDPAELDWLRAERNRLLVEIELCRNPERTPLGALARLPEYATLDEQARQFLGAVLGDDLPVVLRAGEATWIAERLQRKDWTLYGASSMGAIIQYLGPERVQEEVPSQKLSTLRQLCTKDEWTRMFGDR